MLAYPDVMGAALLRDYEPGVWRWMRDFIEPGMTCVDAGANQGFYSIFMARMVERSGMVYAFEPVVEEAVRLRRNLLFNGLLARVDIRVEALGASYATVDFHVGPPTHRSRSSLATLPREVPASSLTRTVTVTRLDDIDLRYPVALIKADVEGAERDLLRGARRLIATDRPAIVLEVADVATRQFGYPAQELLWMLAHLGYDIFEPHDNGDLTPMDTSFRPEFRTTVIALPRVS